MDAFIYHKVQTWISEYQDDCNQEEVINTYQHLIEQIGPENEKSFKKILSAIIDLSVKVEKPLIYLIHDLRVRYYKEAILSDDIKVALRLKYEILKDKLKDNYFQLN